MQGGVIADLADLHARQRAAADAGIAQAREKVKTLGGNGLVSLGLASDDAEAQALGWPCVGAHRAVLALTAAGIIALGLTCEIVPRGSTPATAGAADAHGK